MFEAQLSDAVLGLDVGDGGLNDTNQKKGSKHGATMPRVANPHLPIIGRCHLGTFVRGGGLIINGDRVAIQVLGIETGITPLDSDGDRRVTGKVTFQVVDDVSVDWVRLHCLVIDANGLPCGLDFDEEDHGLGQREIGQIETGAFLERDPGDDASASIILLGCAIHRTALGAFDCPGPGGIVGTNESVSIAGVVLERIAVVAGKIDDDGDLALDVVFHVRNTGPNMVVKFELEARAVKRNGQEIDVSTHDVENLSPGATRVDDFGLYLDKKWVGKPLSIELVAKTFTKVFEHVSEPQALELRPH